MVRVLYFVDRMLRGGIQSLVIDWISNFDKEKLYIDFLLLDDGEKYKLEDTLKELGCNVYKLNGIWIRNIFDFKMEAKALDNFFKNHHDYDIIHFHSSSKNYMVLKYAKKYGIKVRIAHSHNIDFQTKNPIKKLYGDFLKPKLKKYTTDYFACSKDAGKWLFGKEIINSSKFKVVHNAVDYDKFKFDENIRIQAREEFDFNEKDIVIGHVGRFTNQKNHTFLIDIFSECYKNNKNYKLLMVGTGALEEKIKEKVKKLNLEDRVVFAGFREDASELVQSMDLVVFPSLYEGLSLSLIEAQANGLTCFTSKNVVPEEVKLSDNFYFIELSKIAEEWAEEILNKDLTRQNNYQIFKDNKYFLEDTVKFLEDFYCNKTV